MQALYSRYAWKMYKLRKKVTMKTIWEEYSEICEYMLAKGYSSQMTDSTSLYFTPNPMSPQIILTPLQTNGVQQEKGYEEGRQNTIKEIINLLNDNT